MSNSPSHREQRVARLFSLYADLGWAVPTGIENARLVTIEDSISVATNALESCQAPRGGRAIDRHEDTIVAVLDAVETEGVSYIDAVRGVSDQAGLTEARLDQLVRCWCAIAGIEVPA